ncbi:MAG: hypothetical protein SNJ75_18220 [Gemmataceae bacterium]
MEPRWADHTLGMPPRNEAIDRTLAGMARVRVLLNEYVPGMAPDRAVLLQRLETPLTEPLAERERQALRGWLLWWLERYSEASEQLAAAVQACLETDDKPTLALAAYWQARVRLRLREEAIQPYESVLRKLGGSPQATAAFVDLLWRAGRTDRAELVWKSVRSNKRVAACVEGQLLEARLHLSRGEWNAAEKWLNDCATSCGPFLAEVHLLRAWLYTCQNKRGEAEKELLQAQQCPYPSSAMSCWREAIQKHPHVSISDLPVAWEAFLRAQQARAAGERPVATYRMAADCPALALLARYGLVMLGEDQACEVLPRVTSPFWGIRLRAHAACERFARRELPATALLEALAAAARAEYTAPSLEHFRRLAQGDYRDAEGPEGPMRDNALLFCLEQGQPLPAGPVPAVVQSELHRQQLYQALQANDARLAQGVDHPAAAFFGPDWLSLTQRFPDLARALAVHAAVQRADVAEAVAGFSALQSPPAFVVRAMQALWLHRPTDALLNALDLEMPREAPTAWWLHRAARAMALRDYQAAAAFLAFTDQPLRPQVEQLAQAQRLAAAFPEAGLEAERLLPLVQTLQRLGHTVGACPRASLEQIDNGPVELRHPLAILFWRSLKAESLDVVTAQRAWEHWLACEPPAMVIEHLLQWHREAIVECLMRGKPEAARKHWDLLHGLPELAERLVSFRDQLATQFLVQTREVMRHAEAPLGLSADYERGLTLLRRLLSLDRDNIRLLVALIEICNDWFVDCYNAEQVNSLRELVQRHRPFAEHLNRLIAEQPGEITARTVLSDFWKARGFIESDTHSKAALYREALKLNPNNENVQQLLADLQGETDDEA